MSSPRRVVIDTDPGIDDAMAIAVAMAAPSIEVVALTTVHGNHHLEVTTANARPVLDALGRPDIPVVPGADQPLERPAGPPATIVHGEDGLGDAQLPPLSRGPRTDRPAAVFIAETALAHPGEITLVAIGPLTNLAEAIAHAPEIVDAVTQVVIMGGAWRAPGNVTPWAEANVHSDPEAAARVLASGIPVVLFGLDVTRQLLAAGPWLESLATSDQHGARHVARTAPTYRVFHRDTEDVDGIHCHDVAPVAYLLCPDMFELETAQVEVVLDGDHLGETVAGTEPRVPATTMVAVDVDASSVMEMVRRHLTTAIGDAPEPIPRPSPESR